MEPKFCFYITKDLPAMQAEQNSSRGSIMNHQGDIQGFFEGYLHEVMNMACDVGKTCLPELSIWDLLELVLESGSSFGCEAWD